MRDKQLTLNTQWCFVCYGTKKMEYIGFDGKLRIVDCPKCKANKKK